MNKVKCIIVDDERKSQKSLLKLVEEFCEDAEIVGIADSVHDSVRLIHETKPNIVFLDIEMPEEDGFKLFDYVDRNVHDFWVVFVTAHSDYAIPAIKIAALDYILKPVQLTELKQAIDKVKKMLQLDLDGDSNRNRMDVFRNNLRVNDPSQRKIALYVDRRYELVEFRQIIRCEADRSYSIFHLTGNRQITVSKSLNKFVDILESANFIRIHRSHMVNVSHIIRYIKGNRMKIMLSDHSLIEVAHRRRDVLIETLEKV
ncbi:MAG: LytTR family DNA-binding domain-containing protein [Flavobacteriales bacterium]|jgi:two-component system LytT family response regulator|nr:LytTR family DNA-binding domain-containing protein [Flavobacteriales bacterium]